VDKHKCIDLIEYLIKWICSYLPNREQHVVLNEQEFTSSPVILGVAIPRICVGSLALHEWSGWWALFETVFHILIATDDLLVYKIISY